MKNTTESVRELRKALAGEKLLIVVCCIHALALIALFSLNIWKSQAQSDTSGEWVMSCFTYGIITCIPLLLMYLACMANEAAISFLRDGLYLVFFFQITVEVFTASYDQITLTKGIHLAVFGTAVLVVGAFRHPWVVCYLNTMARYKQAIQDKVLAQMEEIGK